MVETVFWEVDASMGAGMKDGIQLHSPWIVVLVSVQLFDKKFKRAWLQVDHKGALGYK